MSQYLDWKVGDKVVCVDDAENGAYDSPEFVAVGGLDGLRKDAVYTIRSVGPDPEDGFLSVWLEEIYRQTFRGVETGYAIQRFRKVQPRKTSIAIFERMLKPERVDA